MVKDKDEAIYATCKAYVLKTLGTDGISPEMVTAIAELIRVMMEG